MTEDIKANRRRGALILGFSVVVTTIVVTLIFATTGRPVIGAVIGVLIGTALAAFAYHRGLRIALRVGRARPTGPEEQPRLHNLIEGLRITAGLQMPGVFVVDDPAPNAFVAGCRRDESALVVTTGLLQSLERIELEAVIAHLLTRIRSREVMVSTLAMTLIAGPVLLAELSLRTRNWNGGRELRRGDRDQSGSRTRVMGLIGAAPGVLAPILAPLVRAAAPPQRVLLADLGACQLTRFPPGLIRSLCILDGEVTVTHAATAATAHLWFAQPMSGIGDEGRLRSLHRLFAAHPPLEERIALVREL
jgi:heat shock protein HtpX